MEKIKKNVTFILLILLIINFIPFKINAEDSPFKSGSGSHRIDFVIPYNDIKVQYYSNVGQTWNTITDGFLKFPYSTISLRVNNLPSTYEFVGWYVGDTLISSDISFTYTYTKDVTMSVVINLISSDTYYTITGTPNNLSYGYVTGGGSILENSNWYLSAIANDGYEFVSWSNGSTSPNISGVATQNINYIAYFRQIEIEPTDTYYSITGTPNNSTYGYVIGSNQYLEYDEWTLQAIAFDGYEFVKWSNDETNDTLTGTATEDIELIAIFQQIEDEPTEDIDLTETNEKLDIINKSLIMLTICLLFILFKNFIWGV